MVTAKTNNSYHYHSNLYLFPYQLFPCLSLVFTLEKLKKSLFWRSSLNKEWNITTKPVVSVWFIHFSTYFYHFVRFTQIYHFHTHTHTHTHIYIYKSVQIDGNEYGISSGGKWHRRNMSTLWNQFGSFVQQFFFFFSLFGDAWLFLRVRESRALLS